MRASYDAVAEAYAESFFDELGRKPFDCQLLDAFAARNAGRGLVLDVGCGPGHVARYLRDRGVHASGVDVSPAMVEVARRLTPGMEVTAGDMRRLPVGDGELTGLTAFYSVIHIPREGVLDVLREFSRALAPGGLLLMSVHGGEGMVHREEFLGHPVPFEATLFSLGEIVSLTEAAGFWVEAAHQRAPYEFEHQTPRIYVSAHVRDSLT
jgi:SAM-dependent methyltransferase